jgi:predicted Zn-dependent protease
LHLAQAHHFLLAVRDDQQAQVELDLARETLPNNAELENMAGLIARRQLRVDDAIHLFDRAVALQPREPGMFNGLAWIYRETRRYADADRIAARLLELRGPQDPIAIYLRVYRAACALEGRADPEPLRATLAAETPADESDAEFLNTQRVTLAFFDRDPDGVLRALAAIKSPVLRQWPKAWFEARAARMRGDEPAAQAAFAAARQDAARRLEINPGSAAAQSVVAIVDAGLGRTEDAERGALRACELSAKRSPATKIRSRYDLATVYASIGQPDKAFALLRELIAQPANEAFTYEPSYGGLRLDPIWEPLRGDPRFAELVQRLAPVANR